MNIWQRVLSPFYELDRIFAIVGILLSLLLIVLGGIGSGKVVFLLVGILILISCSIWLAIRRKKLLMSYWPTSGSWVKFWATCFFVLYITSIIAIYLRPNLYERPIVYFILTTFMVSSIALESLSVGRRHARFVLVQILMLGMSIGWSQMLIFPGVNGIDAWYHSSLIREILYENHIPNGYSYSKLPILHLLIGITSIVTLLPIKLATIFTASFGQIACNALFIFLIANSLFKNHQIGLLSALFVVIGDHHIRFSYLLYPNAFGMAFVVILLYLMFNRVKDESWLRSFSILFILLTVSIVLVHSIVAVFTGILLFLFWGAAMFYSKLYPQAIGNIKLLIPVVFTVVMFVWWTYVSMHTSQFANLILIDFDPEIVTKSALDLGDASINFNLLDIVFSTLPIYLFVCISFIGVFYMVSQQGNNSTFTYALSSISPLIIAFVFFIPGRTAIEARWFYFAEILLSIPLALVIYWLGALEVKKPIYRYLVLFIFITVFSFLMITSSLGNHDNYSFPPQGKGKIYHTQSELLGYDFFVNKSTGTLSIDGFSRPVFEHYYNYNNYQRIDLAYTSGKFNHDGSIKLLRHGMILTLQRMGVLSPSIYTDIYHYLSDLGFNRIYDNSGLIGYV